MERKRKAAGGPAGEPGAGGPVRLPADPLTDTRANAPADAEEGGIGLFRALDRIAEMGAAGPETEVFLAEVTRELARRTSSRQAVLSLVDPGTATLEAKAAHGFGAHPLSELGNVHDGIHGWVLKIGTPMIVSDPERSAALPLLPFERTKLLAAPIQVGDDRVGAVSVLQPLREDGYGEGEMLFVSTMASLVGGMIGHSRATARGHEVIRKAIESLTLALDARDPYTRGHSQRVAMYSLAIANELETGDRYSFVKDLRNALLMSALLHDIGKIGIRDEILLKPGKLTDEEYSLIQSHPVKGAEIVRMIPGFDDNVIAGILQHHERFDGKGYPGGLRGDDIHIFGRIIGLADCFDAIVTSRPYSTAASFTYAMQRMEELAGTAFDPEVVQAMVRALKDQSVWTELGSISRSKPDSEPVALGSRTGDVAERTLRRIFGRSVNDLPTLPHVVTQVLDKTRDPNVNLGDVVGLISTDQGLVSTYLRLVNSAFYGFTRRITTLKQAITLLGFRSVRNVVVNAGVVGIFRRRTFNNRYRHHLWNHSVACAVAARVLAEQKDFKAKEEAFTAGLLHDIGKVVIDQYAPKDSAKIMEMVEAGAEPRVAEQEVLGVDHTKIGAWVADRWRLPKSLCRVIEHHHEPDADELSGDGELVRLVATANAMCDIRRTEDDERLAREIREFVDSPGNHLRLDDEEARAVLTRAWAGKREALKTFGPGTAGETVAEIDREDEEGAPEPGRAAAEG